METRIVSGPEGVEAAAALLRAGEVVAFPTETVYGLGADATREDAVNKIYGVKGRPAHNPLIVHVTGIAQAEAVNGPLPKSARRMAEKFWPGPLTLVVPRGEGISPRTTAQGDTVALRAPAHALAIELLAAVNLPLAAPSANISGRTSPTTARHVWDELNGKIPLILDGGPCAVGLESTVVEVTEHSARIYRPGAVTLQQMLLALGDFHGDIIESDDAAISGAPLRSPGLLDRHYAPQTQTVLFPFEQWPTVRHFVQGRGSKFSAALLTYREDVRLAVPHRTTILPNDDAGYARGLYDALRSLDAARPDVILVLMPANDDGLWPAVTDRLQRAGSQFST